MQFPYLFTNALQVPLLHLLVNKLNHEIVKNFIMPFDKYINKDIVS